MCEEPDAEVMDTLGQNPAGDVFSRRHQSLDRPTQQPRAGWQQQQQQQRLSESTNISTIHTLYRLERKKKKKKKKNKSIPALILTTPRPARPYAALAHFYLRMDSFPKVFIKCAPIAVVSVTLKVFGCARVVTSRLPPPSGPDRVLESWIRCASSFGLRLGVVGSRI